MLEWNSELIVNNPAIDHQHLEMVVLLNLLDEAVRGRKSQRIIGSILDDLVIHARRHFATEEHLLASEQRPELEEHRSAHSELVDQLLKVRADVQAGKTTITGDLTKFLKQWFTHHVQRMDRFSFSPSNETSLQGSTDPGQARLLEP